MKIESHSQAAYELDRLRDAWAQLSVIYAPNDPDKSEVVVEPRVQADLEKVCRSLSHALLAWQGEYHSPDEKKSCHEIRLEIREIARRTGAGEPMHKPLLDLIEIDGVSTTDDSSMPEEMQGGRRSKFFVQGWNAAHLKCGVVDLATDALRDATNPYPDQSFRSAEFCGGWNEYLRRNL